MIIGRITDATPDDIAAIGELARLALDCADELVPYIGEACIAARYGINEVRMTDAAHVCCDRAGLSAPDLLSAAFDVLCVTCTRASRSGDRHPRYWVSVVLALNARNRVRDSWGEVVCH